MKKTMLKLGAFLFVLGLGVVVFWPVNHWRLYDALARPLALTHAENYCTGIAIGEADFDPDAKVDQACWTELGLDNTTPSIRNSVQWGCEGIYSVVGSIYPVVDCMADVESADVWFLVDGGYTWYWDEHWPRPVEVSVAPEEGRGQSRGDFGESNNTTTTTVEEEETE